MSGSHSKTLVQCFFGSCAWRTVGAKTHDEAQFQKQIFWKSLWMTGADCSMIALPVMAFLWPDFQLWRRLRKFQHGDLLPQVKINWGNLL